MSMPIKDNAHILSDQRAFQEAYAGAREFFAQIEGVVGVGFGQKQTGGQYKDDIAIIVFVREKKKEEEIAPEQRIASSFEGYLTDVRTLLDTIPGTCDNTASYDTIQGGIQICPENGPSAGTIQEGTLGCIVRKRNDASRENVYLLSNKHVLQNQNSGVGGYIYHPFPPGKGSSNSLGPVQDGGTYGNVPFTAPGSTSPTTFFIDCAIARVDLDSKCFGSTCTKDTTHYAESIIDLQVNSVNTMSDVRNIINDVSIVNTIVFKVGRTTGKTQGTVKAVNVSVSTVGDPTVAGSPPLIGQNCIEIAFDRTSTPNGLNCKGHSWFAEQGDSGSMVVDAQNRVIGIISQVPPPGSPTVSSAAACHILPILDSLSICVPCTTGTSHGSSRATDGSGSAPASISAADSTLPAGEIVFTSQQVEGRTITRDLSNPVPVTDDEVRHMRELLQALRSTQKGRDLHNVFAQVRREIGYLVRNCRPVKVAWHRNKGPAFFTHVLNHLKGYTEHVPREVDGISLGTLLTRMSEVLSKYGSHPLRRALEQYGDELISMLTRGNCNCVQDCIAYLQEKESP
jgi:hypothetical protein